MITLPEYAKKNGYKYKAINEIINFLHITPAQEIHHFRSFDENKLDSLFMRLNQLRDYTPEPPNQRDETVDTMKQSSF